jgi:hypothetical protein
MDRTGMENQLLKALRGRSASLKILTCHLEEGRLSHVKAPAHKTSGTATTDSLVDGRGTSALAMNGTAMGTTTAKAQSITTIGSLSVPATIIELHRSPTISLQTNESDA